MCPILNSLTCSSCFSVVGCTIFFFFFFFAMWSAGWPNVDNAQRTWVNSALFIIVYYLFSSLSPRSHTMKALKHSAHQTANIY